MCGIAGFVSRYEHRDQRAADEVLDRMCRVITHRGPDDQGTFVNHEVALGMRRLSVIDLAGGHQPMFGCADRFAIVFNGEIYNFQELQAELEKQGHRFRTHSDTEAILHAYEQQGASCVDQLRGMFAFAIWDKREGELFVARDRAGKKPLYYTISAEGTLIFGSELKSLREHPEFRGEIDAQALDAYLTFGYVPDSLTIFRGVHKLAPGHYLKFKRGRISVHKYWDFPCDQSLQDHARSEHDWIEELQALLDEAVRVRLIADVPLGAFLSGGIDSSAVVGLMARHTGQPVKTFSIGFNEDSYNELKYARIAAQKFGTDHHEFIVTPDICDVVDELVWHFDEPFADSSAIPTFMVSKLAREHVTVALSGDGGDELFAGYTRYATHRRRDRFSYLPRFIRRGLMQGLSRRLPHGATGRNFLYQAGSESLDCYLEQVSVFSGLNKPHLYTEDFRRQLDGDGSFALFRDHARRVHSSDPLDTLLYLDAKTYLPGDILAKVDRMSMAVSLETRTPLLDHKLIELVSRIPAELKMKGFETKYIFKRAVADFVPKEILNRQKQGFGVPIVEWINRELRERIRDTFADAQTRQRGYIEPQYVDVLLDEHERGRRDHSTALWSLFVLELWHRTFDDARGKGYERPKQAAFPVSGLENSPDRRFALGRV
ncbi:MAG TPA: asparagine synthase (glutamine-hydrolyzing) [Pyrinomonadaceae bacterium]